MLNDKGKQSLKAGEKICVRGCKELMCLRKYIHCCAPRFEMSQFMNEKKRLRNAIPTVFHVPSNPPRTTTMTKLHIKRDERTRTPPTLCHYQAKQIEISTGNDKDNISK